MSPAPAKLASSLFLRHVLGLPDLISRLMTLSVLASLHWLILDLILSPTIELRIKLNSHYKTRSMLACLLSASDKTKAVVCPGIVKATQLAIIIATTYWLFSMF